MSSVSGLSFGAVTAGMGVSQSGAATKPDDPAVESFLSYMKKSSAERMADSWLAAHGLTREKLDAMTPEERDAVLKKMAADIKNEMDQATSRKLKESTQLGNR